MSHDEESHSGSEWHEGELMITDFFGGWTITLTQQDSIELGAKTQEASQTCCIFKNIIK